MRPDRVLCPVEIHVHDPMIREQRQRRRRRRRRRPANHYAEKRHRQTIENSSKRWILIDDRNPGPSVPETDGEELPYPEDATEYDDDDDSDSNRDEDDTGSRGKREWSMYDRSEESSSKQYRADLDFGATYPLANSHGNAYLDSSSHSRYTELYSEHRDAKSNLEMARSLDATSYAIANSHGEHGNPAADIRDRYGESLKNDSLVWETRPADMNYDIANSHSNYRVFYDSQTQHHRAMLPPRSSELWSENHRDESHVTSKEPKDNTAKRQANEANQSEGKNEPDSKTTCDIERCLVQIEESLLNIEQNLLHVQDLDIPELRNLLYKSPSIERSLYEVQDLLYADGIVPVIPRKKSMSFNSDEEVEENEEEEEVEEEEEEEEEVWVGQNITIKENDDEDGNAGAPLINISKEECSDTVVNADKHNSSRSADDHCADWTDDSNVLQEEENDSDSQLYSKKKNYVLNSLGKTLPRKIALDEVIENIRLCSSEPEEPAITIDYNLNSACAEKKSLFRDKWHSRASSLDENSIFRNSELGDKRENDKLPLQDVFLTATGSRRLAANVKALSAGTLQTDQKERHDRGGSHEEKLLQAVEATAADFRKKLESFTSQRPFILHRQKKTEPKLSEEISDNATSRSKDKSPMKSKRATIAPAAKAQDKGNGAGKNTGCDKRKRKKTTGKNQSTAEKALVPSKLISLSLSLLLAALLQAVRCLTDLVEDAFRSVSYDRSGLLQ